MISNKSENDKMIDLFLETSSGSQWKQLMFKLYRRFKIFGKKSMTEEEYSNVSYFISNCSGEPLTAENVVEEEFKKIFYDLEFPS